MPQTNKYKSFQSIAWISKNQEQISDNVSFLKNENIDVQIADCRFYRYMAGFKQ